jgi:hypothetical protein
MYTGGMTDGSQKDALIEEMVEILRDLDDASIMALRSQAEVYLQKALRNQRLKKLVRYRQKNVADAGGDPHSVTIEQDEHGFFIIVVHGYRIFFNRDELRELTRICWSAPDPRAAAVAMFRWFERERSDFLNDTGINTPRMQEMKNLYDYIISRYTVRPDARKGSRQTHSDGTNTGRHSSGSE